MQTQRPRRRQAPGRSRRRVRGPRQTRGQRQGWSQRPGPARRPWQPPRPPRAARTRTALARLRALAPPRPTTKRTLDLLLGSALLLLVAPALAAAALALAVRRRPGGVLDRSLRTGPAGRPFVLRSLRTRRLRLDALSRLPHVVRGELSWSAPNRWHRTTNGARPPVRETGGAN